MPTLQIVPKELAYHKPIMATAAARGGGAGEANRRRVAGAGRAEQIVYLFCLLGRKRLRYMPRLELDVVDADSAQGDLKPSEGRIMVVPKTASPRRRDQARSDKGNQRRQ